MQNPDIAEEIERKVRIKYGLIEDDSPTNTEEENDVVTISE